MATTRKRSSGQKPTRHGDSKKLTRGVANARKRSATGTRDAAKRGSMRKPNAAFMKPVHSAGRAETSAAGRSLDRAEITKRLWAYIKKNGLQNSNRRLIFDSAVAPRNLGAQDIRRMVSGPKIKLG